MSLFDKLSAVQGLSPWFFDSEGYPLFQFAVGWKARVKDDTRTVGDEPGFHTHPDVKTDWNKLPEGVQKFIGEMSTWQLLMFSQLNKDELSSLRKCGEEGTEPDEELNKKVRSMHHLAWMTARNTSTLFDLAPVRDHDSHRGENLMTPEEVAKNNPQVKAYSTMLAAMEDKYFSELLAICK